MVTVQPAQGFVHHQGDVASLARRGVAALCALHRGGVPAAVLEQNDLPARVQRHIHLVSEQLAEPASHAALLVLLLQIRHENLRQHRAPKPLRQRDPVEAALVHQPLRFHGWGRRPEHGGHLVLGGQPQGHVAGVIAGGGVVLLETGFVFFVDHNQPQLGQGQQHGAARPHDELALFRRHDLHPRVGPLSAGEPAVVHLHHVAKKPTQAGDQLGRQGDFRHQEQHLVSCRQRLGNEVGVDLCLSGPCDALQQHRRARHQRTVDVVVGLGLGVGQGWKARRTGCAGLGRLAVLQLQDATLHPLFDGGGVGPAAFLGLNLGQFAMLHHRQQQALHGRGPNPCPRQGFGQLRLGHPIGHLEPSDGLGLGVLLEFLFGQHKAPLNQGLDDALGVAKVQEVCAFTQRHGLPHMQGVQEQQRRVAQTGFRHLVGVRMNHDLDGAFQLHPRREGRSNHLTQGAHVVGRHPREEVALRHRHDGRFVHHGFHLLRHVALWGPLVALPDDGCPLFSAQCHHHTRAHHRLRTVVKPLVRQRFGQSQRHHHLDVCGGCVRSCGHEGEN